MPHNVNRKPIFPDLSKQSNRKLRVNFKRIGKGILKWVPLWIGVAIGLWLLIPELQPHDQFDIVYEKGNPNNSNWAGYYKDKQ